MKPKTIFDCSNHCSHQLYFSLNLKIPHKSSDQKSYFKLRTGATQLSFTHSDLSVISSFKVRGFANKMSGPNHGILYVPDGNVLNSACRSLSDKLSAKHRSRFEVIPLTGPNDEVPSMIGVVSKDANLRASLPETWHGFHIGRVDIDPDESKKSLLDLSLRTGILCHLADNPSIRIPRLMTLVFNTYGFTKTQIKKKIVELLNEKIIVLSDKHRLTVRRDSLWD